MDYVRLAAWGYGKEAVTTTSKTSPTQSFTVVMNQQGDTPVIEDGHHSDSDHSENSSSDEGSSDNDEPEHQSEDD